MLNFLELLRNGIRDGLTSAEPGYCERHSRWLSAQQQPDGGFPNRHGVSDLYYTAFALRGLSVMRALTVQSAGAAAAYLTTQARQPREALIRQPSGAFCDMVAAASWWDAISICTEVTGKPLPEDVASQARLVTMQRTAALRRGDGGWAKADIEANGSLYHTFLAQVLHAHLDERLPHSGHVKTFLHGLAQPKGGFLENCYSKTPGVNGSAAGIFLSLMLEETEGLEKHMAAIAALCAPTGGFLAAPRAPGADLLSTFTALTALELGGALQPFVLQLAQHFTRSLESRDGGYIGFALETDPDCEYTFYGLGVESICAARRK